MVVNLLAGETKSGVDAHAAYLIRQAAGALRGALDKALEPVGLTHPQFAVLAILDLYPGASGAELARLSQLTPQTLTVITRNLAAAGLVRRTPVSQAQRQIPYELTDIGGAALADGKRIASAIEERILRGLGTDEIATVKAWLVEVAKRANASTE